MNCLLKNRQSPLFLTVVFFAAHIPMCGQMPSGSSGQNQTVQATQLPSSGRTNEVNGTVTTMQTPTQSTGANVVQPSVVVTGNYQGSVPGQESASGPLTLSLVDAVRRGLEVNLGAVVAAISSNTGNAQIAQARSALLPQISANLGATETQISLATFGLNSLLDSGLSSLTKGFSIPSVIGPFHYVQAQGELNWNALNITAIRNWQTSKESERATRFNQRDARELIVLAVGGTYLQALAYAAQVEAEKAEVGYAKATYDQAAAELAAGTTARIDVARSQVQWQTEQERLNAFQGQYDQELISLARLIGVPLGRPLVLAEPLEFKNIQDNDEMGLLRSAYDQRMDLKAAESQLTAARLAVSSARSERYPAVSVSGTYGAVGVDPTSSHGVFTATGSVNIPLWEGGKISADVSEAEQTVRQREAEYQDQKQRVEQDVRNALIQLRTAVGQVRLAQTNRQYALDTLTQARDRFTAGVTTTVEVTQAQQQESNAESDYINGLFAYNLAKLALARATGAAETNLTSLLEGKHQ